MDGLKEFDLKEKEKKHKLIFSFFSILSLKRGTKVALFLLEKTDGTCAFFQQRLGSLRGAQHLSTGGVWVPNS